MDATLCVNLARRRYYEEVRASYACGTFRHGPLHALSLVGTKQEECGQHFPAYLASLEASPFLGPLMPWGDLARTRGFLPPPSLLPP